MTDEAEFPTFESEYARCLAEGHVLVPWPMVGKRLCQRCGRTAPAEPKEPVAA